MNTQQTVRDHAAFRSVLQAMSRPGSIQHIPEVDGCEPLMTLLSSLLDNEVAVAAIGAGAMELLDAVAMATGCRSVTANDADFLLVLGGSSCGHLNGLHRGTSDYPETGASVLYILDEIAAEGGQVSFTGPGIRDRISPLLSGLEDNELKLLGEVNRDFPLGIDAIFIDRGGRLTCIPRSTRIGVA